MPDYTMPYSTSSPSLPLLSPTISFLALSSHSLLSSLSSPLTPIHTSYASPILPVPPTFLVRTPKLHHHACANISELDCTYHTPSLCCLLISHTRPPYSFSPPHSPYPSLLSCSPSSSLMYLPSLFSFLPHHPFCPFRPFHPFCPFCPFHPPPAFPPKVLFTVRPLPHSAQLFPCSA